MLVTLLWSVNQFKVRVNYEISLSLMERWIQHFMFVYLNQECQSENASSEKLFVMAERHHKNETSSVDFFLGTENWRCMHRASASDSIEVNRSNGRWEQRRRHRARMEQKGRSQRENRTTRKREGLERNRRSANFNAVTGFMSFQPFGGFHF